MTLVLVAVVCATLASCEAPAPDVPPSAPQASGSVDPKPSSSAPGPAPSAPPPAATAATLLAVGDVGDCSPGGDRGRASARLARSLDGPILLLGDIAYPHGSRADYDRCFWPSWRPLRSRVRAVIGNHDDRSRSTFFATWPEAGTARRPWYAFEAGAWLVLVVEGNCTAVGCASGSPQTRWVARRLAAARDRCTLLAVHQPRFSSDDEHGDDPAVDALWRTAYRGGVDLVLAGHAHDYERIGPLGIDGSRRSGGPVLLVAGTGGAHLRGFAARTPASRVRIAGDFGLLRLSLRPGSWRSEFLVAPSGAVRDPAKGTCR